MLDKQDESFDSLAILASEAQGQTPWRNMQSDALKRLAIHLGTAFAEKPVPCSTRQEASHV